MYPYVICRLIHINGIIIIVDINSNNDNTGGDKLKRKKSKNRKNPPKASTHLWVGKPIADGFNEALKDSSKTFFSTSIKVLLTLLLNFFINFFK